MMRWERRCAELDFLRGIERPSRWITYSGLSGVNEIVRRFSLAASAALNPALAFLAERPRRRERSLPETHSGVSRTGQ